MKFSLQALMFDLGALLFSFLPFSGKIIVYFVLSNLIFNFFLSAEGPPSPQFSLVCVCEKFANIIVRCRRQGVLRNQRRTKVITVSWLIDTGRLLNGLLLLL